MMGENKLSRDYDGSEKFGLDLASTATQKMADGGPTHATLQETAYGWLNGTTFFVMSELNTLTYADFVEHIGCDAQEYRYKALGQQRAYTWTACDKEFCGFGAFFRENDNGDWTLWATGASNVSMPDGFIDNMKNSQKEG